MRSFFQAIDDFLHGRGPFAVEAPLARRLRWLFVLLVTCGVFYGAVMGSYSGLTLGRLWQLLYSGVKVPLLLLATFVLCLPSFFVINTVAGLREDFGHVLRALVATQTCVTVVLAALSPITAFWYLCSAAYGPAILFNGAMFGVASGAAQIVVRRYYGPLIRRSERHRILLWAWFFLYAFVGIQMGWLLRPFIGDPDLPVAFFRAGAWGNAYVVVAGLIADSFRRLAPNPRVTAPWLAAIMSVAIVILVVSRAIHPRNGDRRLDSDRGNGDLS
jgi:hypothetical protein